MNNKTISRLAVLIIVLIFQSLSSFAQLKVIENGNVGIGTDVPVEKLHVKGNILLPPGFYLSTMPNPNNGQGGFLQGTKKATAVGEINKAGYGIWLNYNSIYKGGSFDNWIQFRGGYSSYSFSVNHHFGWTWRYAPPNGSDGGAVQLEEVAKLSASGDFTIKGNFICQNGTTLACSDIRYKKNFKPILNMLAKIDKIDGIYYDWNQEAYPDKNFDDKTYMGVKAQELEAQFPELVYTDQEGYKSVDYARLSVVLLEAVKEQQKQIRALETKNEETLKNNLNQDQKINQLFEMITQLTAEQSKESVN